MISPRGPLALRRMTAHWVVIAAAALTIGVAATVAAALIVFTGQALPQAVRHDLVRAPDTALTVTALVGDPGQAAASGTALRSGIAAAMPGIPFGFDQALWSDPLGLVPGALPATPAGLGRGNTALVQAASLSGIGGHATLVAGRWPTTAAGGGQPIPAALPASAAALLHVRPGDVLKLADTISRAPVSFEITGLFTPRQTANPDDSYWRLSFLPAGGRSVSSGSATYGPLVVSPSSFGSGLTLLSGSWVAQPDMAAFQEADITPVSANVEALATALPNSSYLSGAQLLTSLPAALTAAAANLTVARSLLVICALELLFLAMVALLAVARLLAAQREAETALLIARGATRSELTRLTAVEVVPLAAVMSVVGALAGIWLAGLLVTAGPLGGAGIRLGGQAGSWPDALTAAIVVTVVAAVMLLLPGLMAGPGAVRARRGRQARVAIAARAGLDLALIVLAVLAGWQLRHYSAASGNGTAGIDPVLALAPALALAAGSVATLRLIPPAARLADRVAGRGRRLTASMASWQLARMPVRQASAALLLTMAVATGTLAFAQHASWLRSASDQAAFATGGDVQVDSATPLDPSDAGVVATARGVAHATAVAVDPQANPAPVLAIDAAQAAPVVRLRGDQTALPSARLFSLITPAGGQPGALVPDPPPGRPAGVIQFTGTLGPGGETGPATVTLIVTDAAGAVYQVPAGTLAADGNPHPIVASLGGDRAQYPLRVAAITATFESPHSNNPVAPLSLTLSGLPLAGWTQQVSSGSPLDFAPSDETTTFAGQAATFLIDPGYSPQVGENGTLTWNNFGGQLTVFPRQAPVVAIPAIATAAFMNASNTAIGGVVPAFVDGTSVPLQIVAEVASFPTVTGSGGGLVTDLGSLQEYLIRHSLPLLPVSQWWLATADGGAPAALTAGVPPGTSVVSADSVATATAADTLSAAPQQAVLALAAAAALLAITGFWVSIAADVRRRRGESALLAALGVSRREAAVALSLEKLLLSLPAAVLGVALGALVAWLLVPAVTLTPAAQLPTPPAVTVDDLPPAIALALAVTVLPVIAAAFAATRRPDPAAELRAAEQT